MIHGAETCDRLAGCFEHGKQAQRSPGGLIAGFPLHVVRRAGECSSSDMMRLIALNLDPVLRKARLGEVVGGL